MAEGTVAAGQLRLFVERIERLEEEKKGIADDIRDVYAEAKANGYDKPTMRLMVRLRKLELNEVVEYLQHQLRVQEYVMALYVSTAATADDPPLKWPVAEG